MKPGEHLRVTSMAADAHPAHPPCACRAGGVRGARRRVLLLQSSIIRLICSGIVAPVRFLRGVERVESYTVPCGCFGRRASCWRLVMPLHSHHSKLDPA